MNLFDYFAMQVVETANGGDSPMIGSLSAKDIIASQFLDRESIPSPFQAAYDQVCSSKLSYCH